MRMISLSGCLPGVPLGCLGMRTGIASETPVLSGAIREGPGPARGPVWASPHLPTQGGGRAFLPGRLRSRTTNDKAPPARRGKSMVGVMDVPVRDTAGVGIIRWQWSRTQHRPMISTRICHAGNPMPATSARSWAEGPLISLLAHVTTLYARSVFDHPPTGLGDPDAPDRLPISLDGLALRRGCQSGTDEAGQRAACKAVGEHDRFGSTERTAGEQLERSTLF